MKIELSYQVKGALPPANGGIPAGGVAFDVLTKSSATNFDAAWTSPQPDLATFEYTFDTAVVEPAGSANIRFNSATMTAVTKVWVNHITSNGLDVTNVFTLIEAGMRIFIQDKDQSTKWASFNCTGPTINKGTYDEFPVTHRDHGAALTAHRCLFNISGAGTSGGGSGSVPAGGTAGQVLAKIDSVNYNTQWESLSKKREAILSLTGTPLAASEILAAIAPPPGETWTYPANLSTSSGLKISGGVNPASTYTIDLAKNGTTVATISISTSGVVTFTTVGGTAFSLTGGTDVLVVTGNATPSAAVGYTITLVATWA